MIIRETTRVAKKVSNGICWRGINAAKKVRRWCKLAQHVGILNASHCLAAERLLATSPPGTECWLKTKDSVYPLLCRSGTSDYAVFQQIFFDDEYAPIRGKICDGVVIDCGANVGYSAAYFLSLSPGVRVIAVEPDAANVAILRKNLRRFGDRAEVIHAAVWSHRTELAFATSRYRDGREWARQVTDQPCISDDSTVAALGMEDILARCGAKRIDVLKIDVEGAEAKLFGQGYEAWLPNVDCIAIELHRDSVFGDCESIFHNAVSDDDFCKVTSGEVVICSRREL